MTSDTVLRNRTGTRRPARHTTPDRRRAGRGGYTLVEVSLACLVLAIGLASIVTIFPVALKWGGKATHAASAAYAARSCVDLLENRYADSSTNISAGTFEYHKIGQYYCRAEFSTPDVGSTWEFPGTLFLVDVQVLRLPVSTEDVEAGVSENIAKQFSEDSDVLCTVKTFIHDR